VGKGTVVRRLLQIRPGLALSISCTTRAPRPGERPGAEYRFVTPEEFDRLVDEGRFLEWAEVFGHRYGTLSQPIRDAQADGRDVILEIDVQGAANVRRGDPDAVLIFLMPPSSEELARRLAARRTEGQAARAARLAAAKEELGHAGGFDHVVVNDDVERAAAEVAAILDTHSD
jgi:guanylate kinase